MNARNILGIAIPVLAVAGLAAALTPDADPGERQTTIPAGTELVAVLAGTLSTARSAPGDEVELRTVEPVHLKGAEVIPAGILIHGTVIRALAGERPEQPPEIGVRFDEMTIEGDEHPIATEEYRFGTLVPQPTSRHLVLRAGERLRIRLTRPVTVEYHLSGGDWATE